MCKRFVGCALESECVYVERWEMAQLLWWLRPECVCWITLESAFVPNVSNGRIRGLWNAPYFSFENPRHMHSDVQLVPHYTMHNGLRCYLQCFFLPFFPTSTLASASISSASAALSAASSAEATPLLRFFTKPITTLST